MRKISATYIVPGNKPPLKNGILVCTDDGTVSDLIDTGGNLREQAGLEYYSGILVPGFVNAHCHLELSHLKGKIPEHKGLAGFLGEINRMRDLGDSPVEEAMVKAERQMVQAGTVAAGDVSNSVASLEVKRFSSMFYHTFVEAFGFHPSRAEKAFAFAEFVLELFQDSGLSASITPHSSYSVSRSLFTKIREMALGGNSILTIHNQESPAEEMLFRHCSGPLLHHFQHTLGLDVSQCEPHQDSMVSYMLTFMPERNHLLLVHNTYTTADDIAVIKKSRNIDNTFFVLCPSSNLYIENQLPSVLLFKKEKLNLCLGTDSLASNHQLSVLHEMITLQKHFPELTIQELVSWAGLNGARALKIENRFGSFEQGKRPGINLITGADLQRLKLTDSCRIKVLHQPSTK